MYLIQPIHPTPCVHATLLFCYVLAGTYCASALDKVQRAPTSTFIHALVNGNSFLSHHQLPRTTM
ncbi:hypothetical protein BGZ63DRAFT_384224 [Mariannaea sp. PMI_226]|nr:hypothetical protein BGZ63DRAFT_384224 [Mariannaea sp. PMI_226]